MTYPAPFTSTTFADGETIDNTSLFLRVLKWLNDQLTANGGDTGWQTITLAAGYTSVVTPAYRVRLGVVYIRGDVSKTGGFTTSSTLTIAAAGTFPAGALPLSQSASERTISSNTAGLTARAAVATNGSILLFTGSSVPSIFLLGGLSGYIAEA